ncbi:MAG: hypothetical protein FWC16_09890 [Defluviitaleaceae bacterium]|nr:hypothetical protein [Defluviitaleaceae bacterium]MCL2275225.1 hypothetical protein [Defluviitaleaceae bacterium]
MEKMRNIATLAVFVAVLFGLCIAFFVMPDVPRSQAERRLLAQAPQRSTAAILNGTYMYALDEYMQDQFPLREAFRTVNAVKRLALGRRDTNGYYFVAGHLSSLEFPLNAEAVHRNAAHLNAISQWLFEGLNVFYAVIPDKNYFLAAQNGFPALDYAEMMRIMHHRMGAHTYIDLFSLLSIEDFYRTDIHWRQENLLPVAEQLTRYMGVDLPPPNTYTAHTLFPFRGSFHGHAALPVRPDELTFLTNEYTENAIVYTLLEEGGQILFSRYITVDGERLPLRVYMPELFGGMDGYDVFLAGAQAVMTIEIPNATTNRELIIFRDSFGSSITPLLLGGYAKIILVDIRYISTHLLPTFIEITDQDILFLFSTTILNQNGLFR